MKKISTIILLCFISCNMNKTPSCSDERVKEKTTELLKEKIKFELIKKYSNENFIIPAGPAADTSEPAVDSDDYLYSPDEYKIAESNTKKILEKIKLSNIVTIQKIDSIKKCDCESHLNIETIGKLLIKYSAQSTDEGEPYVKIEAINDEK